MLQPGHGSRETGVQPQERATVQEETGTLGWGGAVVLGPQLAHWGNPTLGPSDGLRTLPGQCCLGLW